jgi:hypothetical protein
MRTWCGLVRRYLLHTAPFSVFVWMIDEYTVMVMVMVMVPKWVIQGVFGRIGVLVSAATKDLLHLA